MGVALFFGFERIWNWPIPIFVSEANPKSKKKVKKGKKATFRRGHGKRPKGPKGAEGGVDADSDHASAPHDDDEVSDHDPSDSEVGS